MFHVMLSAIVTLEIFCVCFFCEDSAMEGVWISMDFFFMVILITEHLPGWNSISQSASPSPKLEGLLGVFAVIFCSEGEVYNGVVGKQSDRGQECLMYSAMSFKCRSVRR